MGWNEPGVVCKVLLAGIPATWILARSVSCHSLHHGEVSCATEIRWRTTTCFPVESNSMMKPVVLVNDDDGGIVDKKGWTRGNWTSFVLPTIQMFPLPSSVMALGLTSPAVMKLE